jgi:DnaJ-class molecular chaperone
MLCLAKDLMAQFRKKMACEECDGEGRVLALPFSEAARRGFKMPDCPKCEGSGLKKNLQSHPTLN